MSVKHSCFLIVTADKKEEEGEKQRSEEKNEERDNRKARERQRDRLRDYVITNQNVIKCDFLKGNSKLNLSFVLNASTAFNFFKWLLQLLHVDNMFLLLEQ